MHSMMMFPQIGIQQNIFYLKNGTDYNKLNGSNMPPGVYSVRLRGGGSGGATSINSSIEYKAGIAGSTTDVVSFITNNLSLEGTPSGGPINEDGTRARITLSGVNHTANGGVAPDFVEGNRVPVNQPDIPSSYLFDGTIIQGLADASQGGYGRLGAASATAGIQGYVRFQRIA